MSTQNWFTQQLNKFKDDIEFRLEMLILEITERICRTMAEKNMNRKDLAERLNVSPPAVTKILNGNSNFTLKTLLTIAHALDQELIIEFREKDAVNYHPIDDFIKVSSVSGDTEASFLKAGFSVTSDSPVPIAAPQTDQFTTEVLP